VVHLKQRVFLVLLQRWRPRIFLLALLLYQCWEDNPSKQITISPVDCFSPAFNAAAFPLPPTMESRCKTLINLFEFALSSAIVPVLSEEASSIINTSNLFLR